MKQIQNVLSCVGYVMRQITSRRLEYSEFSPHSLLQLHNSQLHKYCHLQYHNYFFCWSHFHAPDTTQLVAAGPHLRLDTGNWLNAHYSLTHSLTTE
jgi:hypothetical protein